MEAEMAQWSSDYPECPHCGEDVNTHKVGDELYRCGNCDEFYPDLSHLGILAGIDLEDQLSKRGKKNQKRNKDEPRPDRQVPLEPILGRLDREEQALVDLTGLFNDFTGETEQCDYGISW